MKWLADASIRFYLEHIMTESSHFSFTLPNYIKPSQLKTKFMHFFKLQLIYQTVSVSTYTVARCSSTLSLIDLMKLTESEVLFCNHIMFILTIQMKQTFYNQDLLFSTISISSLSWWSKKIQTATATQIQKNLNKTSFI